MSAFIHLWMPLCCVIVVSVNCSNCEDDKLYTIHKKLQDALTNNPQLLYAMKQSFFPIQPPHNWLGSRVIVVPIHTCVTIITNADSCQVTTDESLQINVDSIPNYHQCWYLHWTSSPLLNLVPVDIMLAFEPLFVDEVYSGIVGSLLYRRVDISFQITLPCVSSNSSIERALVLLLSWSKAYVKAQGLPSTWNQEDQGYITKHCDYYTVEPLGYSNAHFEERSILIRKLILMTFLFINLSILTVILKCGYKKLHHSIHSNSAPIYWAAAIAMGIMNIMYLILLIWAHSYKHLPRILLEKSILSHGNCQASFLYRHELFAFTAKVVILCISVTMELILALYIVWMRNFRLWPVPPILAQVKYCFCCCNYYKCLHTALLWQVFVFIQIGLGFFLLPFIVFFIVSPLQSFFTLSIAALIFVVLTVSISHMLYTCRIRCTCTSWMNLGFWCWAYTLITMLITEIMILYSTFINGGLSDSGIKAVLLSLLPSILLSGFVWVIKKRFLSKKPSLDLERQSSISSAATEQEEIDIDDMERGIALDSSTVTPYNNMGLFGLNSAT